MGGNKSTILWTILVILIVIGIFALSYSSDPEAALKERLRMFGVECLANRQENPQSGIHVTLAIRVNGKYEQVPANIGITNGCLAEIHTHDTDGVVHINPGMSGKRLTFGTFFDVWERPMLRNGYNLLIVINSNGFAETEEVFRSMIFENGQQIVLEYTSVATPSNQ